MDKILHDLGQLLLTAVPTFLLIWVLYFYLKGIFFKPLDKVLEARRQATEGTCKLAEETFARACGKASEYEASLRAARAEIYQEQEEARRRWQREHADAIQEAKRKAEEWTKEAGGRLQSEAAEAKRMLETQAGALAGRMAGRVLARRVA
ncbi:MAG: ATP synthase F0 subunit B [Acidobacteria bacterium]|nr:ATP synthase F0 subunit B [Acidobacteriota bacterium]